VFRCAHPPFLKWHICRFVLPKGHICPKYVVVLTRLLMLLLSSTNQQQLLLSTCIECYKFVVQNEIHYNTLQSMKSFSLLQITVTSLSLDDFLFASTTFRTPPSASPTLSFASYSRLAARLCHSVSHGFDKLFGCQTGRTRNIT